MRAIKAFEAGQTLLRSDDTEAGIAKIEQAVSLYPSFNKAYEILEDLYGQPGRYDDAIRVTEHLIRLNPGDYEYKFAIIDYRSLAAIKESRQIQEQLNTLSFVRIHAARGSPRNPPWFMYDFFDETREFMAKNQMVYSPYCFITKVGTDLDVGGQEREDWRVGLCQIWIERQYCQPDCTAMLEFIVDAEIGGELHEFKARIQLLDGIAEIGQCFGSFGESPMLDW